MGVVNVMLLLPQIGHCRRRRCPPEQRSAAALSLFKSSKLRPSSRGVLLTSALLLRTSIALLILLISCARASGENEIAAQSVANNNLRFNNNNNGLATAAAAASAAVPSASDIKIQNLNSMNRRGSESIYPTSNSNNDNGGIRKPPSHTVALLDPSTTSQGRSSSSSSSSSALSKVTYSDRLELPSPTTVIEDNQVAAKAPKVDENSITNITSQLQTHTYLPCKLSSALLKQKQIGNKSVSWVRVRDDHILTVDRMTFITDDRFQSFYSESKGVWTLQIKYVQARDEGIYECQVSTEPKVSAQVQLNVVVPKTDLVGEQIRYVKDGSNAILRCVVRGALESPIYISWFYGSKQIYDDHPRGWKITLERDVLSDNEHDGSHHSIGSLIITSVRKRDSGNYTCRPSNSDEVTVMLHVINGEYSASAITSSSSRGRFSDLIVTIIISVVMFRVT